MDICSLLHPWGDCTFAGAALCKNDTLNLASLCHLFIHQTQLEEVSLPTIKELGELQGLERVACPLNCAPRHM